LWNPFIIVAPPSGEWLNRTAATSSARCGDGQDSIKIEQALGFSSFDLALGRERPAPARPAAAFPIA
jgi:cation diffusion facilitator CzcD-associated flavoprotein CzcO